MGDKYVEDDEREIDIRDLIWEVFSHWRGLIVWALLGMLIAGGFSYFKSMKEIRTAVEASTEELTLDQLEEQKESLISSAGLTKADTVMVDNLLADYRTLESMENRRNDSVFYNLDAYTVTSYKMTYYISPSFLLSDSDKDAIASVVSDCISDKSTMAAVVEASDGIISEIDYPLMVYVNQNNETTDLTDSDVIVKNYASAVVSVNIVCPEGTDLSGITKVLDDSISSYVSDSDINDSITFVLTLANESETNGYSEYVYTEQSRLNSEMDSLVSSISTTESKLTDDQKSYENIAENIQNSMATNQEDESEHITENAQINASIDKKYVAIGFVAGILVYCVIILLVYLLDGKLKIADDVEEYYGQRLFGVICREKAKGNILDKKIYKTRYKNYNELSPSERVISTSNAVQLYCTENNINRLAIIGSEATTLESDFVSQIQTQLKQSGLETKIIANMINNAEALNDCNDFKNMLVVEQVGYSKENALKEELKLANYYSVNVVGAVVMI